MKNYNMHIAKQQLQAWGALITLCLIWVTEEFSNNGSNRCVHESHTLESFSKLIANSTRILEIAFGFLPAY